MNPKILVGSPVNEMYDYCLEEYIKALKSLTYQNYDILLIDNSKGNNFFNKIKSLNIPVIKADFLKEPRDRMVQCRNILREKKIEFRYSKEFDNPKINKLVFDDSYFCHDLRELHIPIYADTSMICKHLIKDKKWIWGNLAKT